MDKFKIIDDDEKTKGHVKYNVYLLEKYLLKKYNIHNMYGVNILSLGSIIEKSNYDDSWKESKINALRYYLKSLRRCPSRFLDKLSKKISDRKKFKEREQKQSKRELINYLTYKELNTIRDMYENIYDAIKDTNMNKCKLFFELSQDYLLLSLLCTDQPPLRPQIYADMKIVFDLKKIDNKNNFLYIDENNNCGHFHINKDKVSDCVMFKKDKKIKLQPHFLRILTENLKYYPRVTLFNTLGVKKKTLQIRQRLQKMTCSNFTFSMSRSSYLNYMIRNNDLNENQLRSLAFNMRHSFATQTTNYKKLNEVTGNLRLREIEEYISNKYKNLFDDEKILKNRERQRIRSFIRGRKLLNKPITELEMEKMGIIMIDGKYILKKLERPQKVIDEKENTYSLREIKTQEDKNELKEMKKKLSKDEKANRRSLISRLNKTGDKPKLDTIEKYQLCIMNGKYM